MMAKYSIILRAYNAEAFLRKSVESVLQQSYSDWELIIVNDGSVDDTGMIADQFAREDARIHPIHQENKGGLLALYEGIMASTGTYVVALDSDDWYEPDYLEKVDTVVQRVDPDMVVVNYNVVNDHEILDKVKIVNNEGLMTCEETIELFLQTTNSSLWNKVIKRQKFHYSGEYVCFLKEMGRSANFGDDLYLLMPVLCGCSSIYQLESSLYNYYVNSESITHQRIQASWEVLYQRIRLMETTFYTIQHRGFMNKKVRELIQRNCVMFSLSVIIQLVKEFKMDRENLSKLRANTFYIDVVSKIPHAKLKELTNLKIIAVFRCFNLLVMLAPNR